MKIIALNNNFNVIQKSFVLIASFYIKLNFQLNIKDIFYEKAKFIIFVPLCCPRLSTVPNLSESMKLSCLFSQISIYMLTC